RIGRRTFDTGKVETALGIGRGRAPAKILLVARRERGLPRSIDDIEVEGLLAPLELGVVDKAYHDRDAKAPRIVGVVQGNALGQAILREDFKGQRLAVRRAHRT